MGLTTYLVDGPLMAASDRRKRVLENMAIDLVQSGQPLESDRDAVRVLLSKGYGTIDTAILAGEARMLAYQEIVAVEMSKP